MFYLYWLSAFTIHRLLDLSAGRPFGRPGLSRFSVGRSVDARVVGRLLCLSCNALTHLVPVSHELSTREKVT